MRIYAGTDLVQMQKGGNQTYFSYYFIPNLAIHGRTIKCAPPLIGSFRRSETRPSLSCRTEEGRLPVSLLLFYLGHKFQAFHILIAGGIRAPGGPPPRC